jgi:hypothetical protein
VSDNLLVYAEKLIIRFKHVALCIYEGKYFYFFSSQYLARQAVITKSSSARSRMLPLSLISTSTSISISYINTIKLGTFAMH